jgi:hypothetical protein
MPRPLAAGIEIFKVLFLYSDIFLTGLYIARMMPMLLFKRNKWSDQLIE